MKYVGEEIYKAIPNRKPLMLLEMLELEENRGVATIDLKGDEWFFACHFPGNPVMPFSLIVECLAQVHVAVVQQRTTPDEIPIFSAMSGENIRLRDKVVPGDKLRLDAPVLSYRHGIAKGICSAYKNDGEQPILQFNITHVVPSQMR